MRILLALIIGLSAATAFSQVPSTNNPHLARALAQIEALQERDALRTLEKARAWRENTPGDFALYHLYRGLAAAGLAQRKTAVESFRTALIIDPGLELPKAASPRVREWFEEAGGDPLEKAAEPTQRPDLESMPGAAAERPKWSETLPRPEVADNQARVRWPRWVALGFGLAATAAAAGGVASGISAAAAGDQAQASTQVEAATVLNRQAHASARTANLLYGTAGALLLAGGVFLVF